MRVTSRRIDGFTQEVSSGRHTILADEPANVGGNDRGARPTELLAMSLASCVAITMQMYADRKGIDLARLEVEVDYELDPKLGESVFHVALKLPPGLSEEHVERLRVIAGKCPVHRTLQGSVKVIDRVQLLPGS